MSPLIEAMWSREDAERVARMIMAATGRSCPCERGEPCPIFGDGRQAERVIPLPLQQRDRSAV